MMSIWQQGWNGRSEPEPLGWCWSCIAVWFFILAVSPALWVFMVYATVMWLMGVN